MQRFLLTCRTCCNNKARHHPGFQSNTGKAPHSNASWSYSSRIRRCCFPSSYHIRRRPSWDAPDLHHLLPCESAALLFHSPPAAAGWHNWQFHHKTKLVPSCNQTLSNSLFFPYASDTSPVNNDSNSSLEIFSFSNKSSAHEWSTSSYFLIICLALL